MAHTTAPDEDDASGGGLSLVDTDIHQTWADPEELVAYLPEHFQPTDQGRLKQNALHEPGHLYSLHRGGGGLRADATPPEGGRPGSSVSYLQEDHFDRWGVDYGVLTGNAMHLGVLPNADYAHAFARAYNDWLIDAWLDADDRFLGSLLVAPQAPERAAEMIREYGTDGRFVQVIMNSNSDRTYGKRCYWPIYEAAEDVGLPVAVHPYKVGHGISHPNTGAGYPSTYFEWHVTLQATFIGHLASLVCEGVFEKFPGLKFVVLEGGLGWVPHLMWRFDKDWKGLKDQTPWLERPPSEYLRDHVRFSTQPIEEPQNAEYLLQILEMMDAERTVMFSSDYPHWDGDSPEHGLPDLPEPLRSRVFYENARELYGLPDRPAAGAAD